MGVTVGIDAGTETLKTVLVGDGEMLYASTVPTGIESLSKLAEECLKQALEKKGLTSQDVSAIAGTGVNAREVSLLQEEIPEAICAPLGAYRLFPNAHTLMDAGASKFIVMKCQEGRAIRIARSDKCASGVGISLRMAANVLQLKIEDIGRLAMKSTEGVSIQSTCSVFAETEIISLLHHYKKKPEDILQGVVRGVVSRFYSLLLSAGIEEELCMIGGVARNEGIVRALEEMARTQGDEFHPTLTS